MSDNNAFRLGSSDIFPPAERHVYLDAASVGLSHKGGAEAISKWQNALADEGTIAFDEQAEVECLDNLNEVTARLFNATEADIAVASSETVLMQSLAWAVMPEKGSRATADKRVIAPEASVTPAASRNESAAAVLRSSVRRACR